MEDRRSPVIPTAASWFRTGSRSRGVLLGVALALITLTAYLPVLHAGFVWDDHEYLLGDPLLHSSQGLAWIWQGRFMDWLPLSFTALWAQWQLWGAAPAGYHATNLALHVAAALLLWRVLAALRVRGAWLGAALFAVHPVGAASVAWIMEVKNVLAAAIGLFSFWAFLRFEREGRRALYALSLGAFALALLAKSSVVAIPVLLLGGCWWQRGRVERRDVLRIAPFFIVAGAAAWATIAFQARAIAFIAPSPEGVVERVANAGTIAGFYLFKIVLPVRLGMLYPRWSVDASQAAAWGADLAWLAVIAIALAARRSWGRPVLAVALPHLALLFPVLGLFAMAFHRLSLVGDHLGYLGVIGPAAAAGAGLAALAAWSEAWARPTAWLLSAALLAALGGSTHARAASFKDDESLWRANVESQPGSAAAHELLGSALSSKWALTASLQEFREAVRLAPDLPELRAELGTALVWAGRSEEGIAELREAVRQSPADLRFALALGEALTATGHAAEALGVLSVIARENPGVGEFHRALGVALAMTGRAQAAIGELQTALRLNPEDEGARAALAGLLAGAPRP